MNATDGHNDPFDCFGDSSGSDDDDDSNHNNADAAAVMANLEEAHRLKEKSNAGPISMTHITNNDSFEVFDAGPLSGKGLRATIAYKCGDEILRESAAMRIPNQQSASSLEAAEALHQNAIQRAYNSMHPTTQASFMELSSCNEDGLDGAIRTPWGVYDTNSFRLGNDACGGLFLTIARMNHSCRPNVNHFWRTDLEQTLVFATRDIQIGEELCTIYGPSECMDTRGRREYLSERFSFRCMCEMCVEGNTNGGDERMIEIQSLQEEISLLSSVVLTSDKATAALDSIEKCLALMEKQGIGGGVFTKSIYHHGYDICLAIGDDEGARGYLRKELIAVKHSEGADCSKVVEIEYALNHLRKG
mmetsp:Transcript_18626/g.34290  ORF Transcript_18626/g.34290 Transcript_18626/m.34290 type:complete len:360 (-) Transcript_18626:127-1206(-)